MCLHHRLWGGKDSSTWTSREISKLPIRTAFTFRWRLVLILNCLLLFPLPVRPVSPLSFPFPPPLGGRFATRTAECRRERGGPTETQADVHRRQASCFWNATSVGDFQNNMVMDVCIQDDAGSKKETTAKESTIMKESPSKRFVLFR